MITGRASCGLQYAVRRSGSAVAYCSLSIGAGTRYEGGFHSGIAHFTEHTLFKGTERKNASAINSYLDRLGGELNAYTTKEEIVLHSTVLKEDLKKAASLLLELATEATFPEAEIRTERGVVIDEIKSYKDSPSDDIYDRFEEKLFNGHPLSKPILGTAKSIKEITPDELRRYVAEKFLPERMAFTVVADIDEKKMEEMLLKLIDKAFSGKTDCLSQWSAPNETLPGNCFDETIVNKNNEANAVIGGLAPSLYGGRERIAAILLGNILGGPASNSILNSILREKNGWVYGVESSYTQYADTGIMAICLGCEKENLDKCLSAVKKEIIKMQTIELSAKRLAAAKKQLLGQLAISSDNGEAQCLSMGKSLLAYGKIQTAAETARQIESVTAEEIRDAAINIFAPGLTSRMIML
ncbi:MAG: M16 family metallopeptidase [Candidatus Cryptobacteroides sp.]